MYPALLARDLVCYGCADTVRGGDCQSNTKVMLQEAQAHLAKTSEQQNAQSETNYVKRCSYDNYTYCAIETIENRGKTLCWNRYSLGYYMYHNIMCTWKWRILFTFPVLFTKLEKGFIFLFSFVSSMPNKKINNIECIKN